MRRTRPRYATNYTSATRYLGEGAKVQHRNASIAFVSELESILSSGHEITVRGRGTRELLARTVQLARPTERCITLPGRRNDVFASIAETMWVISGRNDLAFLSEYLPRAIDFSDDGQSWRAGYGPRLRNWNGVDQIAEVLRLLTADPESRRAVIALYDPAVDFVDSKDIPCNNWLHFLIRDGRLDMNIVVRSNDVLWGFSGINTFEWSVLHEMLAFWLGVKVGIATFFISSLHLYADYYERGKLILKSFAGSTGYERGWISAPFTTSWENFGGVLSGWFDIEDDLRRGVDVAGRIHAFSDPLLRQFLLMLSLRALKENHGSDDELRREIGSLGRSDMAYAATEHFFRDAATLDGENLNQASLNNLDPAVLKRAFVELHRVKDAGYKDAWKKRGEQISIMANVARKVDRIQVVAEGADSGTESLFDTVFDLFVYCVKYQTYLADQDAQIAGQLFGLSALGPFSDGAGGFDELIGCIDFPAHELGTNLTTAVSAVLETFSELERTFDEVSGRDLSKRLLVLQALTRFSLELLAVLIREDPLAASGYVGSIFK